MVDVVRIQNPAAYALDDIRALVIRAFDAAPKLPDGETALAELTRLATDEAMIVLVARHEDELQGLAILSLPFTRLSQSLAVYHFYVEGESLVRHALAQEVVSWARDTGLAAIDTLNLNGNDDAFARLFGAEAPVEQIGSLFRFNVGD